MRPSFWIGMVAILIIPWISYGLGYLAGRAHRRALTNEPKP